MKIFPNRLTAAQRTQIKLAKINQKAGKSAISEVGKTIRNVTGQIAANMGYKTYAAKEAAMRTAQKESAKENSETLSKALNLYNKIFEGNSDSEGETGNTATTQVGGAGSAIGG